MFVRDIILKDISSVSETTTVAYLIKMLMRQRRDMLPVVDEHNGYKGVVGVEDIMNAALPDYYQLIHNVSFMPDSNKLIEGLLRIRNQTVKSFMQTPPAVEETDTALHAANLMIQKGLKTIVVVRNQKLVGIVNRVDFLSSIIDRRSGHSLGNGTD